MSAEVEACLICNASARAALKPRVREFVKELVAERPPNINPGIPCWNCCGAGFTGDRDWMEKYDALPKDQNI